MSKFFTAVKSKLLPAFVPRILVAAFFTSFTTNLYMAYLKLIGFPIHDTYNIDAYTLRIYWSSFVMIYAVWFWLLHIWVARGQERKRVMAEEKQDSIWCRYNTILKHRADKMQEVMAEYDRDVHRPALRKLQEECAIEGHKRGHFHDNGLGWTWYYCSKCGAQMDTTGPGAQDAVE